MAGNHYSQQPFSQATNYSSYSGTSLAYNGYGAVQPEVGSFVNPTSQTNRNALPSTNTERSSSGSSSNVNSNNVVTVMPKMPERKKAPTTDNLDPYKEEILERMRKGETGRSIALDLKSRGVNTTEAALGHRRLKWGIRVKDLHPMTNHWAGPHAANSRSIWLPGGVSGDDYEERALEAVKTLGLDSTTADLTGTKPLKRGNYQLAPPGGWKYPHRGIPGSASNLDQFKDEIIERTRGGESLAEIADALMAKGVQTSDRAVGRKRLMWGLRQRKSRANLKNPPIDGMDKQPNPYGSKQGYYKAHPARVQIMRRLEITRMTKEGMSPQEIADHLASRGVVFKKGASSVSRLQTQWGLFPPEKDYPRYLSNKSALATKAARAEQKAAFREIAEEMDVEDVDKWIELKMMEEGSREARAKLAREKLGPLAATIDLLDPSERRPPKKSRARPSQAKKRKAQERDSDDSDESSSDSESESSSEDSSSSGSEDESPRTAGPGVAKSAVMELQDSSSDAGTDSDHEALDTMMEVEATAPATQEQEQDQDDPDSAEAVAARIFARIGLAIPKSAGPAPKPIPFYPTPARAPPRPSLRGRGRGRGRGRARAAASTTTRQATATSQRQKAPMVSQPQQPAPIEDEGMAWYGDDAPATHDSTPEATSPAAPSQQNPAQQTLPQPSSSAGTQGPSRQHTGGSQPVPVPAPWAPTPVLVVRPEEAEANKSTLDVVEQYTAAAQLVKDMVSARTESRALPGSITGMPPSLKDVEAAKQKLKAAAHAMYTSL